MKNHLLAIVGACGVMAGCATHWAAETSRPPIVPQWPYQPARAKLTYAYSLDGFRRAPGGGSLLKTIVYGGTAGDHGRFVLPVAVAVGGDGRIAVADLGRRAVDLYVPRERRALRLIGSGEQRMVSPVAVAFGADEVLYVSDSMGKVFAFDAAGRLAFTITRAGDEPLQRPTGLAYSPRRGLLYVVDTVAQRIHAFKNDGELAFSFGHRGDEEGALNFPTHIFRSASGDLHVTDALNFRVESFDEDGRFLRAFGHHGDGSGDLAMPKGIAVDRDGVVYVVDNVFDNVQLFDAQGAFLLTLGRRGTDFGEFWLPAGAFISDTSDLYVCDTYNRRIQVFRIAERYAETAQ